MKKEDRGVSKKIITIVAMAMGVSLIVFTSKAYAQNFGRVNTNIKQEKAVIANNTVTVESKMEEVQTETAPIETDLQAPATETAPAVVETETPAPEPQPVEPAPEPELQLSVPEPKPAAPEGKIFTGKVDSISLGDPKKAGKQTITVIGDNGQKLTFAVKADTSLTDLDGKPISLGYIQRDNKVMIKYATGADGANKAELIRLNKLL